jgi:hypothetical protein
VAGLAVKIDIFRDTQWVDPLPILSFLIEHPEGKFIVDTGDTWRSSAARLCVSKPRRS